MSKLPYVSLFQILSAVTVKYYLIGLQLVKLSQKLKAELFAT